MSKYVRIGAAWEQSNGSIAITLNGGTKLTLWPNDRKTEDRHPDYRVSASEETAEALGIEPDNYQPKTGAPAQSKTEDIDLSNLPF